MRIQNGFTEENKAMKITQTTVRVTTQDTLLSISSAHLFIIVGAFMHITTRTPDWLCGFESGTTDMTAFTREQCEDDTDVMRNKESKILGSV